MVESGPELSPEEQRSLAEIVRTVCSGKGKQQSLTALVNEWREFVASVNRGYDMSSYDYTNDLSIRDILEEVLSRVPSELRAKLGSRIYTLDESFLKATNEASKPIAGRLGYWWWARVPSKLGSELEADLRSQGILW